jgi:hypothetical protein
LSVDSKYSPFFHSVISMAHYFQEQNLRITIRKKPVYPDLKYHLFQVNSLLDLRR